jgi:hypothetical protein
MRWEAWVFVTLYGLSVVLNIASIGKPRKPMTPGQAASLAVISALLIYLAIRLGT